jgi:predicted nuclease of restriction endonuclease-like (RecB) superfamily
VAFIFLSWFMKIKQRLVVGRAPANALDSRAHESEFREVVDLIRGARQRALQAVNTSLISLYWDVGRYISLKLNNAVWGEGVVDQLACYISRCHSDLRGFERRNLFRMRQFYDAYKDHKAASSLVRQVSWSGNLLILSRREFYLRLANREGWNKRETDRQLRGALFERAVLGRPKVSPAVTQLHPGAETIFKDSYLVDFLGLPEAHSEQDLQKAIIGNLKRFLLELGRDFAFVGEQYLLPVGGQDFRLDLLFYHRELQSLIAIELKVDEFKPEYLGKLEFYLEALDRDARKPHEKPSIGVLLCASKDNEVVEYALSRTVSPALIAEYQTRLPDRNTLQRKLHEFYELANPTTRAAPRGPTSHPKIPLAGKRSRFASNRT